MDSTSRKRSAVRDVIWRAKSCFWVRYFEDSMRREDIFVDALREVEEVERKALEGGDFIVVGWEWSCGRILLGSWEEVPLYIMVTGLCIL